MFKSEPMFKVRILIPREYLNNILIALGEVEILHLSNVEDDEELKEIVKPMGLSDAYYKYTSLATRIEELALNLNLKISPKVGKEDISKVEEELSKIEEEVNNIRFAISKLEEKGETEKIELLRKRLSEIASEV
ncbi:MAG: hypothetical protein DRJ21_02290, partial [Candidatus Methanomethylicota archaeon]